MGPLRSPRYGRRFRARLQRAHRAARALGAAAPGDRADAVLSVDGALRPGEHPQRVDSARSLADRGGASGHPAVSRRTRPGRLSAHDLHDARCRRGGGQPRDRLSRAQGRRPARSLESDAVQERHRLRAAAAGARALAHRHQLFEHRRDLLLSVRHPRRGHALSGALGDPRADDGSRRRDHLAARARNTPTRRRGSSRTMDRNSSRRTSRSSSGSPA